MKTIEVDDELYRYIASQTQNIGESASDILRRLLMTPHIALDEITPQYVPYPTEKPCETELTRSIAHKIEPMHLMQSMLNSDEFIQENRAIGRFMLLLANLYFIDSIAFSEAAEIKGRKRIYFAKSKEVLLASGNASKPRQIPNTPYWVITNTNTRRKKQIVFQLMEKMGFALEFIERVVTTIPTPVDSTF